MSVGQQGIDGAKALAQSEANRELFDLGMAAFTAYKDSQASHINDWEGLARTITEMAQRITIQASKLALIDKMQGGGGSASTGRFASVAQQPRREPLSLPRANGHGETE